MVRNYTEHVPLALLKIVVWGFCCTCFVNSEIVDGGDAIILFTVGGIKANFIVETLAHQ
jgi:hypothetical protein